MARHHSIVPLGGGLPRRCNECEIRNPGAHTIGLGTIAGLASACRRGRTRRLVRWFWSSGRRLGFLFDTEEVAFDAAEHGARIPAMVEHSHQRAAVILLIALSSVVDMRIM